MMNTGMIVNQFKKCLYCGRVNPDAAMQCAGCGASNFEALPPTYYPQPQQMMPMPPVRIVQIQPVLRFVYGFFVGLMVTPPWIVFATVLLVTVVGAPLAFAMYRAIPTVISLYRPARPVGDSLAEGWRELVARYFAAPLWGKVLAPIVFVVCVIVLGYWWGS
jgi:hypothetical protein